MCTEGKITIEDSSVEKEDTAHLHLHVTHDLVDLMTVFYTVRSLIHGNFFFVCFFIKFRGCN